MALPPPGPDRLLTLAHRHASALYRLAAARLGDDPGDAESSPIRPVVSALLSAVGGQLERRAPSAPGAPPWADLWLYEFARTRLPRRRSAARNASSERPFWLAVDALDDQEHLLLLLRYLLGWDPAAAALLLRVSESAVQAQLRLFRQQLAPKLGSPAAPDARLEQALQTRYPAPDFSQQDLQALLERARPPAGPPAPAEAFPTPVPAPQPQAPASPPVGPQAGPAPAAPLAPLLLAALASLCLCLLAGLAGFGWAAEAAPRPAPPTQPLESNLPTPITPAPRLAALTRRSTSDEIRQRWQDSPALWRTAAIDVQASDYGPLSYIGPPRVYRSQAWVSQPGESIELFGLLAAPPTQIRFTSGDWQFQRDLLAGQTHQNRWDGFAASLLAWPRLRWMLYPLSSPWMEQPGSFIPVQTTTTLGRSTLVFDWLDPSGQRQARFWLDAQTGLILRLQEYGGADFQTLLSESMAVSFALDAAAPPVELSNAARSVDSPAALGAPGSGGEWGAIPATPTPAASPVARPTLPPDPVPAGFDPSGVHLIFQLAERPSPLDVYTQTQTARFDLLADGYQLARLPFGRPWGLRCARSPNGLFLAFNSASDGALPADDLLRWIDLSRPERVYKTEFNLRATDFAFSPASDRLAVFSPLGYGDSPPGLYQIDLRNGEVRLIQAAAAARSLAFSPDGEYLAFIGRLPEDEADSLATIHLRTRTVAYQSQPGDPLDEAYNASPALLWQVPFPVVLGGMDACAQP